MKRVAERVAAHRVSAGSAVVGSLWPLVIGIAIAWFLQQLVVPALGTYYAKILLDIGIAIVAAVSLNIVNGFGGQFSIGHAGFMMIGGYAAAWPTYYGSWWCWAAWGRSPGSCSPPPSSRSCPSCSASSPATACWCTRWP